MDSTTQPQPITFRLTKEDAEEISHKLYILADTLDLQNDYALTEDQANALAQSVPHAGGSWNVPAWALSAVRGEMADHVEVLRDQAADARNNRESGLALRIAKQAKRFETMFVS